METTAKNTFKPTISDAMNIDTQRAEYIYWRVVELFKENDLSSDVMKHIMCSEFDTKECFMACFFLGRIKERHESQTKLMNEFLKQLEDCE